MSLNDALLLLGSLAGFAALSSLAVNVLKRFGVVTDGNSAKWVQGINLAGLVIVWAVKTFVPDFDFGVIDSAMGMLSQLGGLLIPILWPMSNAVSGFSYSRSRGFPLVGYSHSK